jgi:hypothetical protein
MTRCSAVALINSYLSGCLRRASSPRACSPVAVCVLGCPALWLRRATHWRHSAEPDKPAYCPHADEQPKGRGRAFIDSESLGEGLSRQFGLHGDVLIRDRPPERSLEAAGPRAGRASHWRPPIANTSLAAVRPASRIPKLDREGRRFIPGPRESILRHDRTALLNR